MTRRPIVIKLDDIPDIVAREFPARDAITVYVGSKTEKGDGHEFM